MNTVQQTEFLYTWYQDIDDMSPGKWWAHPILKRTNDFVFVQYRIGGHLSRYPHTETLKLRRDELEANGEIYWSHGRTLVRCFYTDEKKNRMDELYKTRNTPECLKALGLTIEATDTDVKRAYREAALKSHPDTGGTHEGFLKLQEHYQAALKVAQRC
jgi:hypothetical protein